MNERIRQFAEQAKQYAEDEQNNPLKIYTLDCFNEKFAELIVNECAQACLATTEPGSSVHLVSVAYADAIKRHFG
jgi:hypothetical protein